MNERDLSEFSIGAIESGDFDVGSFDHEAHVYAAWRFLETLPVLEAIERFSSALKRVTVRLGVPGKYHDTVTWFWMLLIAERRRPGEDWPRFRNGNPDLFDKDDNILLRYYSSERLWSDEARRQFLLPDKAA